MELVAGSETQTVTATGRARIVESTAALAVGLPLHAQRPFPVVVPRAGMVITRSVRVQPGTYFLPAPDSAPLITIRGEGLTVDFSGVPW